MPRCVEPCHDGVVCSYEQTISVCQSSPGAAHAAPVCKCGPRQFRPATMTTARPKLPSVLPPQPAMQDGKFNRSWFGRYIFVLIMWYCSFDDQGSNQYWPRKGHESNRVRETPPLRESSLIYI